jgi:hypothetical protein
LADAGITKGPKNKNNQAGGMNLEVVNLLSTNPPAVLQRGMSVAYSVICSDAKPSSPTDGLQLTRSQFNQMIEHGWCPDGSNFTSFEDIGILLPHDNLKLRLTEIKTVVEKDEPTPISTFMGFTDNVTRTLSNLFHVIDVTYSLQEPVSEALYTGLVIVPSDWYNTHNFGMDDSSSLVLVALLTLIFAWVQNLHFLIAKFTVHTVCDFIALARTGPDLGISSVPYAQWNAQNTIRLLQPPSSLPSSLGLNRLKPGKTKATPASSKTRPGASASRPNSTSSSSGKTQTSRPKNSSTPKIAPGRILASFGLNYCASAVFEKCTNCPGGGACNFSHDKPVAGSDDARKLKELAIAHPTMKCRPGFNY